MDEERIEEVMENPLVVHKESDTSYQESVEEYTMEETHTDDDAPTLERHRFRKDNSKKNSNPFILVLIIVIAAAIVASLYVTGTIGTKPEKNTTTATTTTKERTTSLQEAYKDTIVVKNTYIFVDGEEVDGIAGLMSALKYEEPDTTRYTIIDEGADSSFLNDNVLPALVDLKFYDENTVITHKNLTGLVAEEELTTVTTTTRPTKTKNKSDNAKETKSTTEEKKSDNE